MIWSAMNAKRSSKIKVGKKRIEKNRDSCVISASASVKSCSLSVYKANEHKRSPTFINREFATGLFKIHRFRENLEFSVCSLFGSVYAINACHSLGKIKIQKNPAIKDWIAENKKMVGIARFELATFCPPDKRANQAALHPDIVRQYNRIFRKIKLPF